MAPIDPTRLPAVEEDSLDPVGNARKKATTFAAATGQVCLAMDASLTLPELPSGCQPGVHVRRLPGTTGRPTDNEVLDYYASLCETHGGRLRARWTFGFGIGLSDGHCLSEAATAERTLLTPPCKARRPGYPLDSLQQDPHTGRYLAELSGEAESRVWMTSIGVPLQRFVRASVDALTSRGMR